MELDIAYIAMTAQRNKLWIILKKLLNNMVKKNIIHFSIVTIFFLFMLLIALDIAGGDILLINGIIIFDLLYVLIFLLSCLLKKQNPLSGLIGILFGIVLSYLIFKFVEYRKSKIEPEIIINEIGSATFK